MDEINDFFDFSKKFVRLTAQRGCVSGNVAATAGNLPDRKPVKREFIGNDWARSVAVNDKNKMKKFVERALASTAEGGASAPGVNDLEDFTDDHSDSDSDDPAKPPANRWNAAFYQKYHFDLRRDDKLPIYKFKDEILSAVKRNPIIVIQGDTGCGKTTQVPQYILDDAYRRQEYCRIVCTQPRRIAAISIANRVCQERRWQVGSVVGYKVGLHANASEDTRLTYCTTGVLLQSLIHHKCLTQYTHILLDEVHERDDEMDFLLIIIRRFLFTNSMNVKIVLMSATIDAKQFADYFTISANPVPIIRVEGCRLFQVREYYLEDLDRINSRFADVEFEKPGITNDMYNLALKLILVANNIEKQEEKALNIQKGNYKHKNSILVFLPGINEINEMWKKLIQTRDIENANVKLYPIRLHSLISPDEQVKVFQRPPMHYRKVILSTNIAESSITVPDVKYVIDFCLSKYLVSDSATNFTSLKLQWAAQSNCQQRAGRAGRVMNGRVYRLVPKAMFMHDFIEYGVPEMLRCPLERSVLKAKQLDMDTPGNILALAMSPPNLSDILNTVLSLKEIGALYTHINGVYSVQDGDLTYMGRIMVVLPVDVRLSRLIILGHMFSILDDAIIIAAGLSVRSIFKSNNQQSKDDLDGYIQKLVWADGSGSDLFAILKAYKVWISMREQHNMTDDEGEIAWSNRYFINLRSMREMNLLVMDIKQRLAQFGIKDQAVYQRVNWIDREKTIILKIVIAGAFYPNYFTSSHLNGNERERDIYHTLCGNDPCSTVYFTKFNTRNVGPLYAESIKELFRDVRIPARNIDIRFQSGSERVFVSFKPDPEEEHDDASNRLMVPGRVRPEVYKAVRMRMLGMRTALRVMKPADDQKHIQKHGIGVMCDGYYRVKKRHIAHIELLVLPSVFDKTIVGTVSHIETCSKFYFQPLHAAARLREIQRTLNTDGLLRKSRFKNPGDVAKGMLVAAPFDDAYYRARVVTVLCASHQHVQFKVHFVDYGNTAVMDFEELRRLTKNCEAIAELPPPMFECRLAMVQPSSVKCPNGKWAKEAMVLMQEAVDVGQVELEIYSIVAGITNVYVRLGDGVMTLNDMLVERGLARKSDENYMSKIDHDLRLRKQSIASRFLDAEYSAEHLDYLRSVILEFDEEVKPPQAELCTNTMHLSGPFSPLETKLYSCVRVGTWKSVMVERDSVHSVMLDTDPQDAHERLIVAAGISEAPNGQTLTARGNTMMPNIPGFGALMTLLFCPAMQIKLNKTKTKYVAILAGLGYDESTLQMDTKSYQPLYEEHDIEMSLDTDILTDDLELINQIRYCMDTMLFTEPGEDRPTILPNVHEDLAAKIKNIIVRLLNKNRNYIEVHNDASHSVWEEYDPEDIIETTAFYDKRSIFPVHSALRLKDERFERMHAMAVNCRELHRLRQFDGMIQPTTCQLCNQTLENIVQLRIHILSQLHRDREQQIRFNPEM